MTRGRGLARQLGSCFQRKLHFTSRPRTLFFSSLLPPSPPHDLTPPAIRNFPERKDREHNPHKK